MLIMVNFVKNFDLYPPAHIYAGMQQGKAEKRAVALCEELYRFIPGDKPHILGELRSAWRDVIVLQNMANNCPIKINPDYVKKVLDNFQDWAIKANDETARVFKQHPDLQKWRETGGIVLNKEIKSWVYDIAQRLK